MQVTHCDWCGVGDGFKGEEVTPVISPQEMYIKGKGFSAVKAYDLCSQCNKLLQALIQESRIIGIKEGFLPPDKEVKAPKRGTLREIWGYGKD